MSTTPRILGGRYEVGEVIGRGGMADVHLGTDTRLGRTVAIKLLRSDMARDATFLARFRREAQSAASLNHPAIVAIFDSGEDELPPEGPGHAPVPLPYIVMEYVEGETLRQKLEQSKRLQPDEAVSITEGVLDALAFSHAKGLVHRDIKPANVMITTNGHVKVMDFGIARAIADTASTMTQTSSVVGTAQYLSPEQATGQTVDARTDLYSTACMLYELLTGRPPFTGDSPVAIAYQHVGELPQPPSVWASGISGDLDAVNLHALEKDRERRYQSATTFREDLERVRTGKPISAAARATATGVGVVTGEAGAATEVMGVGPVVQPTQVQPAVSGQDGLGAGGAAGAAGLGAGAAGLGASTGGLPPLGLPDQPRSASVLVEEPEPRGGGGGKVVLWVLLALLLLGGIGFGAWRMFGNQTPQVVTVQVPELRDLTQQNAENALKLKGLVGQPSQGVSDTVEEGRVFEQSPAGGQNVESGSTVAYTVSTGPDTVTLTDLAGKSDADAQKELADLGIGVATVQMENDPAQEKGHVLRTDPAAGAILKKGDKVTLFEASGDVQIPADLVGKDWPGVSATLSALKLNATPEYITDKPMNQVLQVEKAGEVVPVGTAIKVQVGVQQTTVTVVPPAPTTTQAPDTSSPSASEPDATGTAAAGAAEDAADSAAGAAAGNGNANGNANARGGGNGNANGNGNNG